MSAKKYSTKQKRELLTDIKIWIAVETGTERDDLEQLFSLGFKGHKHMTAAEIDAEWKEVMDMLPCDLEDIIHEIA